jgi:hypothetical protein
MASATPVTTAALTSKQHQPAISKYWGNPLWGIALDAVSATRERPLFSPSRRPLSAAVAVVPPPPSKPEVPERPQLSLVGTVIGATESIGVFVEQATNEVVRLRAGEGRDGWVLQVIDGRKVTFERDRRHVTLSLPSRNGMDRQEAPMPASAAVGPQPAALIRAQGTRPALPSGKRTDDDGHRPAWMRPQTAQQNLPVACSKLKETGRIQTTSALAAYRDDSGGCPREEALCIGRARGDGSRTGGDALRSHSCRDDIHHFDGGGVAR